ncbi:MAG: ATP-dependent DNA helicase, partial [Lachnospiraceae bacterium]|nr:ATP-dependent DNA helicase [Lachnospiraceae bacterium]
WADFSYYWRITRENSILALGFPFTYRPGQEKLCRDVYLTIKRKKRLFLQAPTGTGKTLSTIFPAIKAMGDGLCDRIFYLTAKTITRAVAKDTFSLLLSNGLEAKTVVLTAKDKICPLEERKCNPDDCPYAKGHFDRINDAVYDLLTDENLFDRDSILAFADERMVCPFELSLDLSTWCDCIVGDYNYVFDPNVYLKRFFAEGGGENYVFLVDEAHNLVERAREMYSASLVKEDFLSVKKLFTTYNGGIPSAINKCNKILLEWKKRTDGCMQLNDIDAFVYASSRLAAAMEKFFEKHIELPHMDDIREFYFQVRNFLNITEALDENYRIYCDFMENGCFYIRLLCVDPSMQLQQRIDLSRACVFFSATLLPVNYYKRLLCRDKEPYAVYATSVFDEKKRFVAIGRDVSSRYRRRNGTEYDRYADYVKSICGAKPGNYMVFGPSYRFLSEIYERVEAFGLPDTRLLLQKPNMTEQEREEYLLAFSKENADTLLGFCVMGGVFSEGIDLTGDRLIGAVIMGVGLPMVTHERGLIADFFERRDGEGFAYAYLYPGMNKVLQAAGRVIRTTEDVGVIALLDERFCFPDYRQTFPREWDNPPVVSASSIKEKIISFWSTNCG